MQTTSLYLPVGPSLRDGQPVAEQRAYEDGQPVAEQQAYEDGQPVAEQ